MTHVNEYSTNIDEGISFLESTQPDWFKCHHLRAHNYWHLSLFYLENERHEDALGVLNEHILAPDDLCNSASFLLRLKFAGVSGPDLDEKWLKLKNDFISQIEHHGYLYTDCHLAMVLSTVGTQEEKNTFFRTLKEFTTTTDQENEDEASSFEGHVNYSRFKNNYLQYINKELAFDLFNSVFSYNSGEYDKVVESLYPIRYELHKIGGSNAQTDIFSQMLIHSALQSSLPVHHKLGLALVNERLSIRPNSNIIKRMVDKYLNE